VKRVKKGTRKRSAVARVRPFWMPIAFCVALVLIGLGVAATWPGFDPRRIAIVGNHRVSRDEILAHASIALHVSIWLQNTRAITRRIEAIPYIATAEVGRVPPATIRIVVAERVPFAVLSSGGNAVVVDRTLRVLEPAMGDDPGPVLVAEPGLELVPGAFVRARGAVELRDAYEAMLARQITPVELEFDRFGGLVITMRDGLQLMFGDDRDLAEKLTLADAILKQVVGRKRRVAAIDLRAPSAPVLVYR
jgi:cell division protein FtsQ